MSSLDSRIRSDLEGKIRSGEWPPGARIPTEHELVAHYGCARMTVHKAITALAGAGLIERRKKAGSFVAQPHVQTAVIEIPDIAAIIAARGETYWFDLIKRARVPADAVDEAAGLAGFDFAREALVLDGLHVAAGRPFCLEHRLINLAAAPEAVDFDFSNTAPGSWLLGHIPWTQARHRITACIAGVGGESLQIGRNAPCLRVERWTWRASQAVTFVRQLFPGDRYDLVAEFTPD